MKTLLDIIQRVRRNEVRREDWLFISGAVADLGLHTIADLDCPEFDEEGLEIDPARGAEVGLRSTIDVETVQACIKWADRLSGSQEDVAAADVIRYYIRFDAWPDALNAPDPPPREVVLLRLDREFSDKLGAEDPSRPCQHARCEHGAVALSLFCRRHHFENVHRRAYPFDD